jgi:PAS domain S-box-containing protein
MSGTTIRIRLHPFGVAVLSVGFALILMLALNPLANMTQTPFLLFFGAVVVSARWGGVWAGVVATVLSACISNYLFLSPLHSFYLGVPNTIRMTVFILECLFISVLCGSLRTTNQRLDRNLLKLRLSEESLRTANQRITDILESITDGFYTLDRQWRFAYINSQAETTLQRSRQELLGRSLWEVVPASQGTIFEQHYRQAVAEQQPRVFETSGIVNPQSWYEVHVNPLGDGLAIYFQNVTQRKQAEEALRHSEARFRQMAETIQDVFWITDCRTPQILYVSPAYEQIWGRDRDELYRDRTLWIDTIHPDDREKTQRIAMTCQHENFVLNEYRIIRPDGSIRWIRDRGFAVRNSAGEVEQVVGVAQDVTEQLLAEQALRQSEAKFRRLVEANIFGVAIGDFKGNVTYANDGLLTMIGYSRADLDAGQLRWLDLTPPEQLYLDRQAVEELRLHGACQPFEKEYLHKDGHRVPMLLGAALLNQPNDQTEQIIAFALDLTQRKQAEKALEDSEAIARARAEELEAFMEVVPTAVWIAHDPDCHQMTANPAAYELMRAAPGAIATATPASGSNPLKFKQLRQGVAVIPSDLPMQRAAQTGQAIQDEIEFAFEDGTVRFIYGKAVPLRHADGTVRGVIGAFVDITDRKQAEEALRLSENRYRTLANAVSQLMWVNDPNGNVQFYNQRWQEYAGMPLQLGVGLWQDLIHPDDYPLVTAIRARALQTGDAYEVECRLKRFDQVYRWHLARIVPLKDDQEHVLQWFGTATDIHDVKQTEAALRASELNFRTLADTMPQMFWTARPDGWIDYYNQRWYSYTGMTYEQTQGWGWDVVLHPDDREHCIDRWRDSIRTGRNYEIECRFHCASNGQYRWHLGRAFPLRDDTGQIIRWFGSCTDIHDQKKALDERDRALERERVTREEAEAANRIKDEFLAVLSHELRSPLNPILGWTKLLRTRQFDQATTNRALETIERNAKLQTQLIEDLLDVSRILRGKLILNVSVVDLIPIIEAAIETVRLAAEAKGIQIELTLNTQVGRVSGDPGRLQQIVWNLLSNAVKFTPEGGRVIVRLTQVDRHAQIQVQDTGRGISPDFLPHVFEYFRQADSTTTRKFGGLGLGLAIVRHFTELHGGTVQAESLGEGLGATFTVRLPMLADLNPIRSIRPLPEHQVDLAGLTVLVVDDDDDIRELLTVMLQQHGAQVHSSASAAEALLALEHHHPDLLISDIGMPGVDGYMLIQQVRRRSLDQSSTIPAIALTAYAGELNQQKALTAGFQMHLSKPIEPEELLQAIATLLNSVGHPPVQSASDLVSE